VRGGFDSEPGLEASWRSIPESTIGQALGRRTAHPTPIADCFGLQCLEAMGILTAMTNLRVAIASDSFKGTATRGRGDGCARRGLALGPAS
jgi:hypothetical protein